MAIKFTETDVGGRPARKDVGGKAYMAEEPSAGQPADLPFAKPVREEKKGPKIRNRAPVGKGKTPAA